MKPLVSILIPAFNAQEFLADTVRSALAQTWPRKEIIIVDDGSTDGTLTLARQFESPEVIVVTQPNQGASMARNTAFSLCHGEFLQWLDADDLLAPDKITQQMELFERGMDRRTLLSSAWGSFYYRASRAKFQENSLWCDLSPVDCMVRKFSDNVYMQTGAWLVSRELATAAGLWDPRMLIDDDGEFFSRVVLAAQGMRFVREARIMYRWTGPSSLSYLGHSRRKMEALLLSMRLQIGYLRSREDSPRVHAACLRYLQTNLPAFYPGHPDLVAQAQQLAVELGGQLAPVDMSWKYVLIQKTFGRNTASRVQQYYNQQKTRVCRAYDKNMLRLEALQLWPGSGERRCLNAKTSKTRV